MPRSNSRESSGQRTPHSAPAQDICTTGPPWPLVTCEGCCYQTQVKTPSRTAKCQSTLQKPPVDAPITNFVTLRPPRCYLSIVIRVVSGHQDPNDRPQSSFQAAHAHFVGSESVVESRTLTEYRSSWYQSRPVQLPSRCKSCRVTYQWNVDLF